MPPPLQPARAHRLAAAIVFATASAAFRLGAAEAPPPAPVDFADLSLEDLAKIKVYSVSKTEQELWGIPSAVHVLSSEDILASGATRLPDTLRFSPGVAVASINTQRSAVSIRGFAGEFADKLLVLQDGRSLYSPQFSGVYWDIQDTLFADIDRIEVVRGPGGTAWGVNAMNGVVNIITKSARDTQGSLVEVSAGTLEKYNFGLRHGGRWGENASYRIYAKAAARDETEDAAGNGLGDDMDTQRAGFRVDGRTAGEDDFTVQGDAYLAHLVQYAQGARDPFDHWGANLLGRWTRTLGVDSQWMAQAYLDVSRRDSYQATSDTTALDLELHRRLPLGDAHVLHTSANVRFVDNTAIGNTRHYYDPENRSLGIYALAIEDTWTIAPDKLLLIAGAKAERNDFTGWEVLPSVRLSWTPRKSAMLWASATRGARMPDVSNNDLNIQIPGNPGFTSTPNRDLGAEVVNAFELGWRWQPVPVLFVDVSVFANYYDDLTTNETLFVSSPPTIVIHPANNRHGEALGAEAWLRWRPRDSLRIDVSITTLDLDLTNDETSTDTGAARAAGTSPELQASARLAFDMTEDLTLDTALRYVSEVTTYNIPAYTELDLRLTYQIDDVWEVAVSGRNLLDTAHPEFARSPGFPAISQIPREYLLTVSRKH